MHIPHAAQARSGREQGDLVGDSARGIILRLSWVLEDGCEVVLMRKYDAGGTLRAVTQYVYPTVDMLADTLSSG